MYMIFVVLFRMVKVGFTDHFSLVLRDSDVKSSKFAVLFKLRPGCGFGEMKLLKSYLVKMFFISCNFRNQDEHLKVEIAYLKIKMLLVNKMPRTNQKAFIYCM
jgi:hypothetical protein